MSGIWDWSTSAAANGTSDATAGMPEGMLFQLVNDRSRGQMARIAALLDQLFGNCTMGGVANAYTITSPSGHALAALAAGQAICLVPAATNTGAATVNVDGLGGKSIVRADGSAVAAGELVAGGRYLLVYNGTAWQAIGGGFGDPQLAALAGLSPAADRMIRFTGATSADLVTCAAFGLVLLATADAAAARTALGLGALAVLGSVGTGQIADGAVTAAKLGAAAATGAALGPDIVNTSTSQTVAGTKIFTNVDGVLEQRRDAGGRVQLRHDGYIAISGGPFYKLYHSDNDGAGSGLDADTLDGLNSTAFPQLGAQNTFTQAQTIDMAFGLGLYIDSAGGANGTLAKLATTTGSDPAMISFIASGKAWAVGGSSDDLLIVENSDDSVFGSVRWRVRPGGVLHKHGAGAAAYVANGTSGNAGKISWGTAAVGTLVEGEIYLRHA